MNRRRARLAAPFLVTFAALPACGGSDAGGCKPPDCHMNPPPPPPPPQEPSAVQVEPPPTATFATPPPPTATAKVAVDLPQPTGRGKLIRRPDGTCLEWVEPHCPPQPATCNPPPPRRVACPPDK